MATCKGLGVFWKLLFRWKGSIYKLVWQNLLLYMALYYALSFTYRLLLDEKGRVSNHIDKISPSISESPKPFKQGSIDIWKVFVIWKVFERIMLDWQE